jgi:hypothetical protein
MTTSSSATAAREQSCSFGRFGVPGEICASRGLSENELAPRIHFDTLPDLNRQGLARCELANGAGKDLSPLLDSEGLTPVNRATRSPKYGSATTNSRDRPLVTVSLNVGHKGRKDGFYTATSGEYSYSSIQ